MIALALVAVMVIEKTTDLEWREIPAMMQALPASAVLPLTAILPLFGFPISIVYLVLGAKFGPWIGLAAVAFISSVHVAGTYWISRSFLRKSLERWLERRNHHIPRVPEEERISVVVIAVLAPVLPYFVRNYALALADIPLRILLCVAVPLYTLRSGVALFLGNLSGQPSLHGFILLGAIYAAKLGICAALVWRIRRHHKARKARASKPETTLPAAA